ncbi:hypothetical protein E2C01_049105 [Portunus trituberculatus]|uniref:Uncharacterized protein n=1 Tax=Portunus trituberculatus TaxID=210409 RepID=A0A5B7GF57_PORTR|nr:hypothetical protein [Portunus trituberculatus]
MNSTFKCKFNGKKKKNYERVKDNVKIQNRECSLFLEAAARLTTRRAGLKETLKVVMVVVVAVQGDDN